MELLAHIVGEGAVRPTSKSSVETAVWRNDAYLGFRVKALGLQSTVAKFGIGSTRL